MKPNKRAKTLRPLLVAIQFLTLMPIKLHPPPDGHEIGRSLLHYPLVGLLIGLSLFCCTHLFNTQSDLLTAILLLIFWVAVTGGLHLDGLADSADAWLGGLGDRQRTLDIMHDPCSGPIAVSVILLLLLLKFAALHALLTQELSGLLILPPLIGRTALVALLLTTPYVRPRGLGSQLTRELPKNASRIVIIMTSILIALWLGRDGILILFVSTITFLLLRRLMLKRINGTTGDTAGALLEIMETITLLSVVMICQNESID
jgi:adenosylcobinamide-GDP ribazoletransferase